MKVKTKALSGLFEARKTVARSTLAVMLAAAAWGCSSTVSQETTASITREVGYPSPERKPALGKQAVTQKRQNWCARPISGGLPISARPAASEAPRAASFVRSSAGQVSVVFRSECAVSKNEVVSLFQCNLPKGGVAGRSMPGSSAEPICTADTGRPRNPFPAGVTRPGRVSPRCGSGLRPRNCRAEAWRTRHLASPVRS